MKKWDILTLLTTIAIALALASIVYARLPRLYNATSFISDETEETTIAVGITSFYDREEELKVETSAVYDKIIDSNDFIDAVCRIRLGEIIMNGQPKTYGDHLARQLNQSKDAPIILEDFKRFVKHSHDRKANTITISVFDKNANIAAIIADSVVALLQEHIQVKKHIMLSANERFLDEACAKAYAESERARLDYASYFDSHRDAVSPDVTSEIDRLKKASAQAYKEYTKVTEKHMRAKFLLKRCPRSFCIIQKATVPLYPTSPSRLVVFGVAFVIGLIFGVWMILLRRRLMNSDWNFSLGGWFSPWSITLLVWAAILLLIQLENNLLDPLTSQFYKAIALWIPSLSLTAFITYNLMGQNKEYCCSLNDIESNFNVSTFIFNVLFFLSLVMTPLYAWNVYQIVSRFSMEDLLSNVRLLANEGEGQGILAYSVVINQVLLIVALWRYPFIKGWQLTTIILSCLLGALAIMEKGAMFYIMLMCFFVMYERRVVKLRTLVLTAGFILVVFYIFNLARSGDETYSDNETFADFIAMYLASPAVAFCRLSAELTQQVGTNTFEFFYAVLDRFGFGPFVVHQKLQDFVWVPMPTNVYTIMQPFFTDFGFSGVAVFGAIYGFIFGVLYRNYRNGDGVSRVLYSYAIYILVLQFYQDNLMLSLSYIIQITIITILLVRQRVRFTL